MKVLKEECKTAKKIRELEEYLRNNDITISQYCGGLRITVYDTDFIIVEDTPGTFVPELPTCVEPTRIRLLQ